MRGLVSDHDLQLDPIPSEVEAMLKDELKAYNNSIQTARNTQDLQGARLFRSEAPAWAYEGPVSQPEDQPEPVQPSLPEASLTEATPPPCPPEYLQPTGPHGKRPNVAPWKHNHHQQPKGRQRRGRDHNGALPRLPQCQLRDRSVENCATHLRGGFLSFHAARGGKLHGSESEVRIFHPRCGLLYAQPRLMLENYAAFWLGSE